MRHTRIRAAEPKDMPELARLLAAQHRRDGTSYPMPELFDANGRPDPLVPMALIIEHGGKTVGGILFESAGRGVEMMLVGCSPRVTLMAEENRGAIEYTLKGMGFEWIRCFITKSVVKRLRAPMKEAGFRRTDTRFASFFKEI